MGFCNIAKHWRVKRARSSAVPRGLLISEYEILHGAGAVHFWWAKVSYRRECGGSGSEDLR